MKIDYTTLGFNPVILLDRLSKRFASILKEPFYLTIPNGKNALPKSILYLYGNKIDGTLINISIDLEDKDKSDNQIYHDAVEFITINSMDVVRLETDK